MDWVDLAGGGSQREDASAPIRPSALSPFRYPGGKSLLRTRVVKWIRTFAFRPTVFVEPFLGGGSVSLAVAELDLADRVVMGEIDPEVASVWKVVLGNKSDELCSRIREFHLTRDSALACLEIQDPSIVAVAFRCILRNRVQRGGIMAPGAGLLNAGEDGKGISSRWYPETLAARIESINRLKSRITFIKGDGLALLGAHATNDRACAFVDPPYFANGKGAGQRLYTHYDVDAELVFKAADTFLGPAMLTYHRAAAIRHLAKSYGMRCSEISVRTAHARKRKELVIVKSRKAK